MLGQFGEGQRGPHRPCRCDKATKGLPVNLLLSPCRKKGNPVAVPRTAQQHPTSQELPPAAAPHTLLCAQRARQPPTTLQRLTGTPDPTARAPLPPARPQNSPAVQVLLQPPALRCRPRSVTPVPLTPPAPEQPGGWQGEGRRTPPGQGQREPGGQQHESPRCRSLCQEVWVCRGTHVIRRDLGFFGESLPCASSSGTSSVWDSRISFRLLSAAGQQSAVLARVLVGLKGSMESKLSGSNW